MFSENTRKYPQCSVQCTYKTYFIPINDLFFPLNPQMFVSHRCILNIPHPSTYIHNNRNQIDTKNKCNFPEPNAINCNDNSGRFSISNW